MSRKNTKEPSAAEPQPIGGAGAPPYRSAQLLLRIAKKSSQENKNFAYCTTKNADGTITVEWTGGGTFQSAPAVTGPWLDVNNASSPYTFKPTTPILFGRIKN